MTPSTSARALRAVSLAYLLVGLAWATLAVPAIDVPGRLLFDLLDWPLDGLPDAFGRNARWASAVGSGLLVGLALVVLLVVAPEIARGNIRVARGTTIALLAWFVVDSVGSVTSGVPTNAVWNLPFLALWVLPLLLLDAGAEPTPAAPGSRAARS